MTLGAEVLVPVEGQLSLFPEESVQRRSRNLSLALDRLRERFGERSIAFGRTVIGEPGNPHPPLSLQAGRGWPRFKDKTR